MRSYKYQFPDGETHTGEQHRCLTVIGTDEERGIIFLCGDPLSQEAIAAGLMGCKVTCTEHLEKYFHKSLAGAIADKRRVDSTPVFCHVCGKPGRHVPGEGVALCEGHNWRQGPNRWC